MSTKHWRTFLVFESMVTQNFSLAGRIWVTVLLISSSTLAQVFSETAIKFSIILIYSGFTSAFSFLIMGILLFLIRRYKAEGIRKYIAVTLSATLSFYIAFVILCSIFQRSSSDWLTIDIWNHMPRGLLAIYLGLSILSSLFWTSKIPGNWYTSYLKPGMNLLFKKKNSIN